MNYTSSTIPTYSRIQVSKGDAVFTLMPHFVGAYLWGSSASRKTHPPAPEPQCCEDTGQKEYWQTWQKGTVPLA